MNTQFHTPSFGDEDFDLSDCGLLPSSTGGVVEIGGGGSGGIGGAVETLTDNNYMQSHQQQQLQTKRVRSNMEQHSTLADYGSGAHEELGIYETTATMPGGTLSSTVDLTNVPYINCTTSGGGVGGMIGMNTTQSSSTTTMAARKQLNVIATPIGATTTTTTTNASGGATNVSDPNEPVKPLSAYALFFHDTVSAIKPQNPHCSFQELTRIVASMWEALDPQHKNVYNKKNELARNEYLKQLRIYRQQQQDQQEQQQQPTSENKTAVYTMSSSSATAVRLNSIDGTSNNAYSSVGQQQQTAYAQQLNQQEYVPQQQHQQHQIFNTTPDQQQQNALVNNNNNNMVNGIDNNNSSAATTTAVSSNDPSPQQMQMLTEAGSVQQCTRENCNKRAIINPDWEDEYCSNECVVLHCRNVFNAWVKSNHEARKQ